MTFVLKHGSLQTSSSGWLKRIEDFQTNVMNVQGKVINERYNDRTHSNAHDQVGGDIATFINNSANIATNGFSNVINGLANLFKGFG